jgi:DNA-binding response OmpR family regulator
MKLMVICASVYTFDDIAVNFKPLGFDLVHYRHVLKAMDNMDEVDPQAIIISARDFPRHWKTLVQFVRQERDKKSCPIILLHGSEFTGEEAAKAFYIGVNGITPENLEAAEKLDQLQRLLRRYTRTEERRNTRRYYVDKQSRVGVCIVNPVDKKIITGKVKTLSTRGVSFEADDPHITENLAENSEITGISIRIEDGFIDPKGRLISRTPQVSIEFTFIPANELAVLDSFLEDLPLQSELKRTSTAI